MTVSRVINGRTNVRAVTREAVSEAIALLNFSPNKAARSLAGAEQIRLGLLYANPSSSYLSAFLCGALDQASRSDVLLLLDECGVQSDAEAADHIARSGVDGILLIPPLADSAATLARFAEAELPVVAVGGGDRAGVQTVGIDDERAAAEMTRHLLALGHRRIGFIAGSPDQAVSEKRLAGFRSALGEAGFAVPDAFVVSGEFTYRSGLAAACRLLDQTEPPTAIFASNDDMAAAVVAEAHRRGIDVPAQLTICGFDDTALATTIWPELTTIRQPLEQMSRIAVDLLIQAIRADRRGEGIAPARRLLGYELVRRQSDAPPAKG